MMKKLWINMKQWLKLKTKKVSSMSTQNIIFNQFYLRRRGRNSWKKWRNKRREECLGKGLLHTKEEVT